MRILHLMAGSQDNVTENACINMCELMMAQSGISVQIAIKSNDALIPRIKKAGIIVHELPFNGDSDMFTNLRIVQICRAFKPDIVQTWLSKAPEKAPPWKASMKIPKYRTVSHVSGHYDLSCMSNTDYYIAGSRETIKHLVDSGIAPEKIRQINNFAVSEDCNEPIQRALLKTPEDAFVLFVPGIKQEAKDFDALLNAVRNLKKVYVWIEINNSLRSELEALRSKYGLQGRVKFLKEGHNQSSIIKAVDACISPLEKESFGTEAILAWAHKKPLLVSDAASSEPFVEDEENAFVFPIDDVDALKKIIMRISRDSEIVNKLIEKGYATYMKEFTAEKSLNSYIDFYKEIITA